MKRQNKVCIVTGAASRRLYQRWPAWVRTMIDGFRDAAAQLLISDDRCTEGPGGYRRPP
ncbi:hypothetical protein [Aquabacterium sp.]|uniref:hypothetical protein n=1 Tax=Aquabacterium sp. TaxID=1872578 RepID=UPI002CB3DE7A|nr:hypothetical protein [Aquabacterium sp.]HSW05088.1 hypothetical protein [Aquabacterium sp.]